MKKTTVIQEIKSKIESLKNTRAEDLQTCRGKISEAEARKRANEKKMAEATNKMDLDAYEEGKREKEKAEIEIEMYTKRYEMLLHNDYVSEEESDGVFQSIDDYEREIAIEFYDKVKPIYEQLREILSEYEGKVYEAEETLKTWENDIHANYRSKCTTYAETGTNRSPEPIRYRMTDYTGGEDSAVLKLFLNKVMS